MMMNNKELELELEKKCVHFARENGYVSMKIEKNGHKGVPDRLFIGKNRIYFIEFKKSGGGVVSKQQVFWNNLLKSNKIESYFCDNFDEFKAILNH